MTEREIEKDAGRLFLSNVGSGWTVVDPQKGKKRMNRSGIISLCHARAVLICVKIDHFHLE